jgi:hypothetical protein
MASPLVTIVSPVYNQEQYVARCVESALAQRYQHWEQIFVDDGSTDATREVIARYRDPRIHLVALPHRGLEALGDSYNAALAVSRGTLVGILEGDDLWPPDKLERQVPLFDDPRTVVSWGCATLIDDAGRTVGRRCSMSGRPLAHVSTGDAFLRLTRTNFLVPSVTVMVRRSALDAVGGFQQWGSTLFVDLSTWLWLTASQDGRVTFLDHVLGEYRVHAGQTTQRKHAQMARQHWQVVQSVERALDARLLSRVGWTAGARRRALSRGMLADGEVALAARDHHAARAAFGAAFRLGAGQADRLLAALGVTSAVTHVDLVSAAFRLAARVRSLGRLLRRTARGGQSRGDDSSSS